jgi:hypothetical protein
VALRRDRKRRKRFCAAAHQSASYHPCASRWRRLTLEQFEPRTLLTGTAPVGQDFIATTPEDTAYIFKKIDFGFSDPSDTPPDAFSAVKITTLPVAGSLLDDGHAVSAGQFVSAADIDSSRLQFVPSTNGNGLAYATFTFQVQDSGVTATGALNLDPTPNTATINVTLVNDPPVALAGATSKLLQPFKSSPHVFTRTDFGFTDPGDMPNPNNLLNVYVTPLSANVGLLTYQAVSITGPTVVSAADLDAGKLVYMPPNFFDVSTSFDFKVQDDGGTLSNANDTDSTRTMRLFVAQQPPSAPVGIGGSVTTLEDLAYSFQTADFGFTDSNIPENNFFAVKVSSLPSKGQLSDYGTAVTQDQVISVADILLGKLRYQPPANANGNGFDSFLFKVQDDADASAGGQNVANSFATLTINVTPVNDPPRGTNVTIGATTYCSEFAQFIMRAADFGFTDTNDQPPNSMLGVWLTFNGFGTLTDNGVTVAPHQFIPIGDLYVGNVVYTANGEPPSLPVIVATIQFQVQDDGGTAGGGIDVDPTPKTINFFVIQPPGAAPPPPRNGAVSAYEDTAYQFRVNDFPYDNLLNLNLKAVNVTSLPGYGLLTDNGVAVAVGQVIPVVDIATGKFRYQPLPANSYGSPFATFKFEVQLDWPPACIQTGTDFFSVSQTLTINVLPVNDQPAGADRLVTLPEDNTYAFSALDFPIADLRDSPPNSLLSVKITSVPTTGQLQLAGVNVQLTDPPIAAANLAALRFVPGANLNDGNTARPSFTFQVQDNGGTANGGVDTDSTPNTITISVTPVNDPPQGSDGRVTTPEDQAVGFSVANFGFSDANDSPKPNSLLAVVITSLPTSGTLKLGNTSITQVMLPMSVAAANISQLVFVPKLNANDGNQTQPAFTFVVKDNGGTLNGGIDTSVMANTMTISVTAVNDPPAVMTLNNYVSTLEDTPYVFSVDDFGFVDPNDSPSNRLMAVILRSLPTSGVLRFGGNAIDASMLPISVPVNSLSLLAFMPEANANDLNRTKPFFTFQVKDDGTTVNGGVDTSRLVSTITISVTSVNDPPQGMDRTVLLSCVDSRTLSIADFGYSDLNDDPSNYPLGVKISFSAPLWGKLTYDGVAIVSDQFVSLDDLIAGKVVYTSKFNADSLQFQVQDNGGTSSGGADVDLVVHTLQLVKVFGPGHSPLAINHSVTTLEDESYAFQSSDFGFSDPLDVPPNNLNAVRIASLPTGGVLLNNGNPVKAGDLISVFDIVMRRFTFVPSANSSGLPLAFQFQVQDDSDCGVAISPNVATMTINVTPVNDAPTGTARTIAVFSGCNDFGHVFTVSDFAFTDPNDSPQNSLLGVVITTLPAFSQLTDDGTAVTAGQFVPVADMFAGKLVLSLGAFVGPIPDSFSFQVKDSGGTANGGVDLDPSPKFMTISVFVYHPMYPVQADPIVNTLEDRPYTFSANDFLLLRDFDGNYADGVTIATLPAVGTLLDNGTAVVAGQFVSAIDVSLGRLSFTPPNNANGATLASFQFEVAGEFNVCGEKYRHVLTINVAPVNDPPMGTDNRLEMNGAEYTFTRKDFGFSDPNDSSPNNFRAVRIASLPALGSLRAGNSVVAIGQFVSVAEIDSGLLRYLPPDVDTGSFSFTFQVQDDGGTANGGLDLDPSPKTMTMAFDPQPGIGKDSTIATPEDAAFTFSPPDFATLFTGSVPGADLLQLTIESLPASGLLTDNGVNVAAGQIVSRSDLYGGLLRYIPPHDANGSSFANFTFETIAVYGNFWYGDPKAIDTVSHTITIDVTPVNDEPSFVPGQNQSVLDTNGLKTVARWAQGISAGPSNEAGQRVHFLVTNDNSGLFAVQPAVDGAGQLTFEPAVGASGVANVTIVAIDDGGTASGGSDTSPPQTFTITISLAEPLHNRVLAADVTGDGNVVAGDALDIINFIHSSGSGPVVPPKPGDAPPTLYYDVTGDNYIAADDVIAIINYIHAHPIINPEATEPAISSRAADVSSSDALYLMLAIDAAQQSQRRNR